MYESQDQPFSFQKHVWFGDRSQVPDLKSDADPEDHTSTSQAILHSSMPYHGTHPLNRTFDINQISPLTGGPQDAATIAAEVSAVVAAQVSKGVLPYAQPKDHQIQGQLFC